jgi:4-oxalocrotonate tautomerase
MPYVNIKVTDDHLTPEEKTALIQGVTELLYQVLDKPPKSTYVVIDEVPFENWGVGGVNAHTFLARQANKRRGVK